MNSEDKAQKDLIEDVKKTIISLDQNDPLVIAKTIETKLEEFFNQESRLYGKVTWHEDRVIDAAGGEGCLTEEEARDFLKQNSSALQNASAMGGDDELLDLIEDFVDSLEEENE